MILPFGALLAAIALAPLFFADWWARHYPKVAVGLAATTLTYYLAFLPAAARGTVLHTAEEYLSFMALIGALFVVSGGIHITVKGEATPHVNVLFLLIGALSLRMVWDDYRYEETSPGIGVPQWWYSIWLPICSLAIALRAMGLFMRRGRQP